MSLLSPKPIRSLRRLPGLLPGAAVDLLAVELVAAVALEAALGAKGL